MKKIRAISSFASLIMIVIILSSCSFTTANFSDVAISSGMDGFTPVNVTNKFNVSSPAFYVSGDINNAPDGTVIAAVWYYAEEDPDYLIDSSQYEVEDGVNTFYFTLSIPDNGWPLGTYAVDLMIDGEVVKTLSFTVE